MRSFLSTLEGRDPESTIHATSLLKVYKLARKEKNKKLISEKLKKHTKGIFYELFSIEETSRCFKKQS